MTPSSPATPSPALRRGWSAAWPPALALGLLLGVWELYVDLGGVDPLVLPAPHAVIAALFTDRSELLSNFAVTAEEVLLGVGAGALVATGLALAIHLSRRLRRGLLPLLVASQAVPIVLVAAVLLIWLGFGLATRVAIIGLVSFFPIVVTTLFALEGVDPEQIRLLASLGAGRLQILRFLELPAALPGLFTGLRLAAVFAVTGAVFAELTGTNAGLGYLFEISLDQLQAPTAFAAVTVLAAFAIVLYGLLALLGRRLAPWAQAPSR